MRQVGVATAIVALTALSWLVFPGHTWLQQDTQIYAAILEHLRDPGVLRNDILVQQPHVSFTLYDEMALAAERVTGMSFKDVLEAGQLVTRALGILGLYLMATALGLGPPAALLVSAIIALGATIGGPAVLSFEIEPDPRGFAVPLLLLAVGLVAHRRDWLASTAGSLAFLLHPPTVYPFWIVYALLAIRRRRLAVFLPIACAAVILLIAARLQTGAGEPQVFFARLTPLIESLQRMRAPYSYISEWWRAWLPHYLVLYTLSVLAYLRLPAHTSWELRSFLVGLPLIGILSVPISYVLLDRMKWGLLPQAQPMRALLFVTVIAEFSGVAAAILAGRKRRYPEALAWLLVVYAVPVNENLLRLPSWHGALAIVLLAAGACLALRSAPALLAVALAGFFVVPFVAGVRTHPELHTRPIEQLSAWARSSTTRDAVFLFADAGKQLQPGIFRAEAQRAVYVDWKGGGQVNYLSQLGQQWWSRWHSVMAAPFDRDLAHYSALGIDYVVLFARDRLPDHTPAYQNTGYVAYKVK